MFEVGRDDSTNDLKARCTCKMGIPAEHLRLICAGREVKGDAPLPVQHSSLEVQTLGPVLTEFCALKMSLFYGGEGAPRTRQKKDVPGRRFAGGLTRTGLN